MVDQNQPFQYSILRIALNVAREGEKFAGQYRFIHVLDMSASTTVSLALNRFENPQIPLQRGLKIVTGSENNIFDFFIFNSAQASSAFVTLVMSNSPEEISIEQLFSPTVSVSVGANSVSSAINKQSLTTAMTSILAANSTRDSAILQNDDSSIADIKVAIGTAAMIGHYIPPGGSLALSGNIDQIFVGAESAVSTFVNVFEFNKV